MASDDSMGWDTGADGAANSSRRFMHREGNSMKIVRFTVAALIAGGFAGSGAVAGDLERGKALHDTFCTACHSTGVYQRDDRLANTYLEVRQQVERWQGNAQLRWSPYDIESVAEYLSGRFYKIPH